MFRFIKNKIKEKFLEHKAKNNWKNWSVYSYKDIFPDRYYNQIKAADELYLPLLPKNAKVLDLGCGDGWFDFKIAPKVAHIDAIDLSEKFIRIAKDSQNVNKIKNINFMVGEVDKNISGDKLYDSVMCMGLFTCILKDSVVNKIINDLTAKLKPKGILFVKDSLNKYKTTYFENGDYAAIYRSETNYRDLFFNIGYKLLHEGHLSDKVSEEGGFSGFKIFRKL